MTVDILLIEDDDFDVKRVTRGLTKLGDPRQVTRARDGLEALEAMGVEGGEARVAWPYVILLDLNMPRMNGIEFLDRMHETCPDRRPPVYVVTTSDYRVDVEAAYRHCIAGYIVKPRTSAEMMDVLQSMARLWDQYVFPADG